MERIPLFELNYDEREKGAVASVLDSKWISSGPKCAELENKIKHMFQTPYACAVSNCTAALHLALVSLGIGAGDEVILPSMTFVATANAIKYVGAEPVFCDIAGVDNITVDAEAIEGLISEKTKAIMVMHYGGFACNMNRIMGIAREKGLYVIEDACHGPLAEYEGKKLGTIGDIGCFSFFANKNIATGEGGMVVTQHESIAKKIKLLRSHGMTSMSYERSKGHSASYDVVELGYNYRMDDIRASLAITQLDKLEEDLRKRARCRETYLEQLNGCSGLILPFAGFKGFTSNYIMPVVLKNADSEVRENVRQSLGEKGIQTSIHYPAVHRFSIYGQTRKGKLDNTEYIADCEISLPMYAKLTRKEIVYICDKLKEVVRGI